MTPLPPTSGPELQDDMMRQIADRLVTIERAVLKRSEIYPALVAAQVLTIGFWTVAIWGLARSGLLP